MEYRKLKSLNYLYEISKNGVLRNIKSKRVLKGCFDKDGYLRYHIENKKVGRFKRMCHQLVMEAWGTPKPADKDVIDHINRNNKDNRIENLRWATISENKKNSNFNQSEFSRKYLRHFMTDANRKPVMLIDKKNIQRKFPSFFEAAKYLYSINEVPTRTFEQIYKGICGNRKGYAYKHKIIKLKPVETISQESRAAIDTQFEKVIYAKA